MKFLGLVILLALPDAGATTYAGVPAALREQLAAAAVIGEFTVKAADSKLVDGAFPVTHVLLQRVATDAAKVESYTVILPGGRVDGKFNRAVPDGFEVSVGETVYVQLETALDLPGYYNLSWTLDTGMLRKEETAYGARMTTPSGRVVASAPCDSALSFVVSPTQASAGDAADSLVEVLLPDNYVEVDDPFAFGGDWADLVAEFDACGGAK